MVAPEDARQRWDGLAEMQELLLGTDTLDVFLSEIAGAAARDLDDGEVSCGVTVRTHQRRPTTLGASDSFAAALDESQYAESQGPCLHALNTGDVVEIPDMATDERWPRFTELAVGCGAGSSLSLPLTTARTGVIGALNLYSRTAHAFTDSTRERAAGFANLAAGAVAIGVRLAQRAELSDDLRTALTSRSTIDQALGIVMEQRNCTADEAFAVLRQQSQATHVKLRDVAAQIILDVTGAPATPVPAE